MKIICGFAAFTSGLYSPYWKRMGNLVSDNTAENIWQSKRCVLGGEICERSFEGHIYAASGCGEEVLDRYIKTKVPDITATGAIWDGEQNRLIVFSAKNGQDEIFYSNPPGRFVFSNKKEGLYSFPGVYRNPEKCSIHCISPGEYVCYDKTGVAVCTPECQIL